MLRDRADELEVDRGGHVPLLAVPLEPLGLAQDRDEGLLDPEVRAPERVIDDAGAGQRADQSVPEAVAALQLHLVHDVLDGLQVLAPQRRQAPLVWRP